MIKDYILHSISCSLHPVLRSLHVAALCALLVIATSVAAQQPSIPIIAYGGVPHYRTSDDNYRVMRECGFDIGVTNFDSMAEMTQALACAERSGIKIIGACPELHSNPIATATKLKSHKALYGYFIEDEPNAERMKQLAPQIAQLKKADKGRLCYINLMPWYNKGQLHSLKANSYEQYVRGLVDAGCETISFDIYPIRESGIRPSWYENLEIIRRESLRAKLPFWAFVLSTPHFDYPQPTIEQLRLQVYSNLAYGAQGIQYYTYWTIPPHGKYDYHNGPVDKDGKKTATYDIVRQMNLELKSVGRLFRDANVTSVSHMGSIPAGTTKLASPPKNISKIITSGSSGAIISQFTKDGHHYAAIVNRSYNKKLRLKIVPRNKRPVRITKQLASEPINTRYTIGGGDILLLKLD